MHKGNKIIVKIYWNDLGKWKGYQLGRNQQGYHYLKERCKDYLQKYQFQFGSLNCSITGQPIESLIDLLKAAQRYLQQYPSSISIAITGHIVNKVPSFKKKNEAQEFKQSKVIPSMKSSLDNSQQLQENQEQQSYKKIFSKLEQQSSIQKLNEQNQSLSITDQLILEILKSKPTLQQQSEEKKQRGEKITKNQKIIAIANQEHDSSAKQSRAPLAAQASKMVEPRRTQQEEDRIKFKKIKKEFLWTDSDIEPYKQQPYRSMSLAELIKFIRGKKTL